MSTDVQTPDPRVARFVQWARRVGLGGKAVLVLVIAVAVAGTATYVAWQGGGAMPAGSRRMQAILLLDLALLLGLGAVVARQLVRLLIERRRGATGSRLHSRLVAMFGAIAVLPAIVVSVASVLMFNLVIDNWFGTGVRTAVTESLAVAEAYIAEHRNVIRGEVLAMATDLNREAPRLMRSPTMFNQVVSTQAALRALAEAVVFDRGGHVAARSGLSFAMISEQVPVELLDRANNGEVVILTDKEDRIRALIRLDGFIDTYLFVGRYIDQRVLAHRDQTSKAVREYEDLEARRGSIQLTFTAIFMVVTLILLLSAVWFGLSMATRLVRPVSSLVSAAERVRSGDFSARVQEGVRDDELGILVRAFNRMTDQLEGQRGELVEANRQLDRRRRFTEAVLSGVSSGVIGLDRDGRVNLPNRAALQLLGRDADDLMGRLLVATVPETAPLLDEARNHPGRLAEGQITVTQPGGGTRTLLVRVAMEQATGALTGFVVTFDDITELMAAQRTAAWADIARRIAHEIKNPLTPIQLSAERLKRKYMKEIVTDPEVFIRCTETIIRQVGDIGRMVDEFSAFARMPSPVLKAENLTEIARHALFLQQVAHPDITFESHLPDRAVQVVCDGRQIAQALTNLLKNAVEAIEGQEHGKPGRIEMRYLEEPVDHAVRQVIEITDNGPGLPLEQRGRLTEPYVTTRAKGTGLGLAIVKKVMEDHGGRLLLLDNEGGGAKARLEFKPVEAGQGALDVREKVATHGA
jgi:two-component system, NtrC family, nitrogen regulation sensor histidine kinase NtrY